MLMRNIPVVLVCCLVFFAASAAQAAGVEFKVAASGSIVTGVKGTVVGAAPPVLVAVESAEAVDNISNAIATAYPDSKPAFREALKDLDFAKYTYAAIFTRPIDNYAFDVKSAALDSAKNTITIKFTYTWEKREYFTAPDLQMFFVVIEMPKTDAAITADYGTAAIPAALKPVGIETILPVKEEPKPSFQAAAQGTIPLNEPVADTAEGPFLYVLKSEEDAGKLDTQARERFKKAGKSLAEIVAGAKPDFGKNIYLVILSAPCVAADIRPTGLDYDAEMGEMLLKVSYTRAANRPNANADLAYCIVSAPKSDAYFVLLVATKAGERRVLPSALTLKPPDQIQIREEYDYRLESVNYAISDSLAQLGAWCVKNGLYEEGRRHLARALKYNPLNASAARALRELDVMEKLNMTPSTPDAYTARAVALIGVGRFADAVKDIDEALKLNDKYAEAYYVKGAYLLLMRDCAGAVKSLDRAIELDPSKARYFAARAKCKALAGAFDESEKDSAMALSIEKACAPALDARAVNLITRAAAASGTEAAKQFLEQARDLCTTAIEADPGLAEAYADRGLIALRLSLIPGAKAAEMDSAFNDCIKSLQINPYQYDSHLHLATYYIYMRDAARAIVNLNRAVEAFPDLSYVYGQRGIVLVQLGENDAALKDFDKAVELAPKENAVYINRGKARAMLKNNESALADFDKAVELSPENWDCYWERAMFHYGAGNLENALTDFGQSMKFGGDKTSIYYMTGLIKMHMEQYAESLADFDKSLESGGANALAYYMMGLVKMRMMQYAEAETYFLKCLGANPDDKLKDDANKQLEEAKKKSGAGGNQP